jgi:phosphatidylinositol-3-phosphatase
VRPCGQTQAKPGARRHVIWIVMENKAYDQIIGSDNAPFLNRLARQCGLATNFHSETSPSLPNYIAMTSGSTQGITDDNGPDSHPLGSESIFSQLGGDWRSLVESMPSNCALSNSADTYAVRHNPAAYFTGIRSQCSRQDVPLSSRPDISARFTLVIPDLCHDMHACSTTGNDEAAQIRTGDAWLSHFIPRIVNSAQYRSGSTAVFVTWDGPDVESQSHVATLVLSPSTPPGLQSGTFFDHYSLLRTAEELLGITSHLGHAANATSMRTAFHLR